MSAARTTRDAEYWDNMSAEHRAHFMHAPQYMNEMMDDAQELDMSRRIPRNEQDEDRWRHVPGRDPVTEERGMGA
jgi:hypothetical protein